VAQTLGALIPFDSSRWLGQIGYGKPHVFAVRGGHWKQIPYGLELYRPVHQAIDGHNPLLENLTFQARLLHWRSRPVPHSLPRWGISRGCMM
jgi:hypothetical protein